MWKIWTTKRGFTLIELVVVITIIALLASISIFSFIGYLASSRDSRRIVDLQSIAVSMDIYYKKNSYIYPLPTSAVNVLYSSGGSALTGAYLGVMTEDKLPDVSQMPTDPKNKTYYPFATTMNLKRYELATRLEKADSGQGIFSNGVINDPSIFGNNIYIVGNYRQDSVSGYYLKGLMTLSGSASVGVTFPSADINVGSWSGTTSAIDYTNASAIVIQKSQTSY